jgi:hypothetical protein
MGITVGLYAKPHARPSHHDAIPAGLDRAAKLRVSHALIILQPFTVQGFSLLFS